MRSAAAAKCAPIDQLAHINRGINLLLDCARKPMLSADDTSRQIWRVFTKKYGLTMQAEACECIAERTQNVSQAELPALLDRIAKAYVAKSGMCKQDQHVCRQAADC